jgi:hypothetical protein
MPKLLLCPVFKWLPMNKGVPSCAATRLLAVVTLASPETVFT